MKRMAIVLGAIVGLWATVPATAQAQQLQSQFNGNTVTNNFMPTGAPNQNQLTATSILTSWVGKVGTGIGNLFSGNPISNLFSTNKPSTVLQQPSITVTGPFSVPNPQQMTNQQFMTAFGIYQLQPLP
jgi:hypothetical protein